MEPEIYHRLSSWRQVVAEAEHSAEHWDEPAITDELLEAHLQRLQSQVLQTLQARDRFYFELKAYIEKGGRAPDQQTLVEEWGATALKAFSQGSAWHLQEAIERMLKAHREQRRRPVSIHSPQLQQQPKSLVERLLGS